MAQSDLAVLLDMGFDKERAELAFKKTGSCKVFLILQYALKADPSLYSKPSIAMARRQPGQILGGDQRSRNRRRRRGRDKPEHRGSALEGRRGGTILGVRYLRQKVAKYGTSRGPWGENVRYPATIAYGGVYLVLTAGFP